MRECLGRLANNDVVPDFSIPAIIKSGSLPICSLCLDNKKTCTRIIIKYTIFYQTMRVLFHYTHKQTLGHTTRSIALAAALCRQKAEVLVLQGGIPQPFIRFPKGCKVLDIPHPFDTRTSFQSRAVPVSAAKRAQFILKAAADFSSGCFYHGILSFRTTGLSSGTVTCPALPAQKRYAHYGQHRIPFADRSRPACKIRNLPPCIGPSLHSMTAS